jgi:predicted anti-sigma-YlaC factor YlaD
MDHDKFRELLCLRLYGETDETERRALDEHLTGCADCRAYASELERGLGALPGRRAVRDDLPAGWRERLGEVARTRPGRGRLLAFVAGLAAGIAVALALRAPSASQEHSTPRTEVAELAGLPPFILRAEAPPMASVRGPFARLAELRAR